MNIDFTKVASANGQYICWIHLFIYSDVTWEFSRLNHQQLDIAFKSLFMLRTQRKHQHSALLALCVGNSRGRCRWIPLPKGHTCGTLQWRHNGRDGVPSDQPHDCLLNRLFRRRWKKTSKLRVTGLCAGNSPVTRKMFSFDDVTMSRHHHTVYQWHSTISRYKDKHADVMAKSNNLLWWTTL